MPRTILMLEHDEDDRYITQAVFDEFRYPIRIDFVANSDDFFKYLAERGHKKDHVPSLILLNYHSAPTSSMEIIRDLKSGSFAHIPIVVLSGSVDQEVVRECYMAGAASFIRKPVGSEETDKKIANFVQYWFATVELPN